MRNNKASANSINRPWLMNVRPLWLRETLFWKLYANTTNTKYLDLFNKSNLEFSPHIFLHLMPTDIAHKSIAFLGFYELPVSRRVIELAKSGGLMIDVGANYGYYSCLWAATKDNNRVIAFEASPKNFEALKLNLQSNSIIHQVDLQETAVGKESGSIKFDLGPNDQSGWGGIVFQSQDRTIEVPVVSLDDFLLNNECQHIDVLKIDTEGADTWVLQGAEKLLRSHKISHIFFEENVVRMSKLGIKPGEAQKLLQDYGYYIESLGGNEWYARI
ncbi:FkbM family methyltransferase [Tolypothrix sp. FACHB-123]|uniref:FkbM family methyltransferase n=1 Tax=Tolypothrix sp. FACHB-123 TaxID=2692868 RepID=UPI001684BB4B|nr:FkbM family methyltransferase [Tolypothrix sp. FACHB-123]MBD2358439.1 FkbM family methyltransferase [Tolypothrix sp. FACHB-123]